MLQQMQHRKKMNPASTVRGDEIYTGMLRWKVQFLPSRYMFLPSFILMPTVSVTYLSVLMLV